MSEFMLKIPTAAVTVLKWVVAIGALVAYLLVILGLLVDGAKRGRWMEFAIGLALVAGLVALVLFDLRKMGDERMGGPTL